MQTNHPAILTDDRAVEFDSDYGVGLAGGVYFLGRLLRSLPELLASTTMGTWTGCLHADSICTRILPAR